MVSGDDDDHSDLLVEWNARWNCLVIPEKENDLLGVNVGEVFVMPFSFQLLLTISLSFLVFSGIIQTKHTVATHKHIQVLLNMVANVALRRFAVGMMVDDGQLGGVNEMDRRRTLRSLLRARFFLSYRAISRYIFSIINDSYSTDKN